MSDSSNYSNMSDLNDIEDIELVMQLNKGESSRRCCKAINRERDVAEARLHSGQLLSNHLRLHETRKMLYLNVDKKVIEKTLKELLVSSKVVGI
ncbi:hypothetical protein Tco_0883203 [Tanacetum coccineum]